MRTVLIAGGLTAAAVAVVIGVASTNQITGIDKAHQTLGYGSAVIEGATVSSVVYNVDSSDESKLASVDISFGTTVPAGDVIKIGFGDQADGVLYDCDDAALTAGAAPSGGSDEVVCGTDTGSGELAITDATKFRLFVSGPAGS